MKLTLKTLLLLGATLSAGSATATELVCDVYPKGSSPTQHNGVKNCFGFDFSFGNSTTGRYYLTGISKPIQQVIWNGHASCSGGTSCNVTVRAYRGDQSATATILYKDGTYEITNSATMNYETGH